MRNLTRIREMRGLQAADVASNTGIAPNRLVAFEAGIRKPSLKQVEKLAEIYNVTPFTFYSENIPNLEPVIADFRKTDPISAKISPRGLRSIWGTEHLSGFAWQLQEELQIGFDKFPRSFMDEKDPVALAGLVRGKFDEWRRSHEHLELSGSVESIFLGSFRLYFESKGGVVNINDAPVEDFMGFYSHADTTCPAIFVNRKVTSKKAQLFSYCHEFAHALIGKEGISNPFVIRNSIERTCNRFAAEFLAPIDGFARVVESTTRAQRDDVFAFISFVSSRSLLSKHATAIRLAECDYLPQERLRNFEKVWRRRFYEEKEDERAEAPNFGHPHAKRLGELGHLVVYLSDLALTRKLCDRLDIERAIGLSVALQEKAFDLAKRRMQGAGVK